MVACEECDAELVADRGCSYCGRPYCQDHRLPEHHDCPGTGRRDGGPGGRN